MIFHETDLPLPVSPVRLDTAIWILSEIAWAEDPADYPKDERGYFAERPVVWAQKYTKHYFARLDGEGFESPATAQIHSMTIETTLGFGDYRNVAPVTMQGLGLMHEDLTQAAAGGIAAVADLLSTFDWAITGTEGDDWLGPNLLSDHVIPFSGDDVWHGLGGEDYLAPGPGNDRVHGGAGADTLVAGPGQDTLRGGQGDDLLDARRDGEGGNLLRGGPGDDRLLAAYGADTLFGGIGSDTLVAHDRADTLHGGPGDDLFYASESHQLAGIAIVPAGPARGGRGDDTFHVGAMQVWGGPGADSFVLDASRYSGTVGDFTPGVDRLVIPGTDPTLDLADIGRDGPVLRLTTATTVVYLQGLESTDLDLERDVEWPDLA